MNLTPVDPIEECVRLTQEVELYKTLWKQRDGELMETLSDAVKIEKERNSLRRELAGAVADFRDKLATAERERDELAAWKRDNIRDVGMLTESRDIWRGKCEQLECEWEEASRKLEQILTDQSYEGGVQYWIAKHDAVLLREAQLRADLTAAQTVLARWKEFLQEVEVAEDRSNLDGDSAEAVLQQLNDGAEEMLAIAAEGVRDDLAAAREALRFIAEWGGKMHETECGTIHCNGSWCAEQASAAIDAARKGAT